MSDHANEKNLTALGETAACLRWEAAVVDLLDGTLAREEETALRAHAAGCPHCEVLVEEAGNGRAWARLLHQAPLVVPESLVGRILAQTSEGLGGYGARVGVNSSGIAAGIPMVPAGAVLPGAGGPMLPPVLPMVLPAAVWMLRGQREARMLMTAAMAFFSIALTLSMVGFRFSDLHAAVQAPGLLQASASRQFFDTKKQVVSFYDNLRLVREMELHVHDALGSRNATAAPGGKGSSDGSQQAQPSARDRDRQRTWSNGLPTLATAMPHLGKEGNTL
jgi:hypothetical protein